MKLPRLNQRNSKTTALIESRSWAKLRQHSRLRLRKTKEYDLLEAKVKAFDLVEAELRTELVKAFAAKDEELASQAEHFKKVEEELVQDVAGAFADGFAEALAQAACANPGIDVSECSPMNEIVEGKIVPLEALEE